MSYQIWKFPLLVTQLQAVIMPEGAEILSVGSKAENLVLWAKVDPAKDKCVRSIEVFGTGQPIPSDMGVDRKFIGTVVMDYYVWHVFERF